MGRMLSASSVQKCYHSRISYPLGPGILAMVWNALNPITCQLP